MKKLLLLLPLFIFSKGFSQLYQVADDEKISNSTLIVEGKVVEQNPFWNENHTMIFTANKIKVYKVFKGAAPSSGYVEIMTQGGTVGNEAVSVSELLELAKDQLGIFCCYPNVINLRSPQTSALLYDVYASAQGFFSYDVYNKTASAPFSRFRSIENELYPKIKRLTGENITVVDPGFTLNSPLARKGAGVVISSFAPATVNGGATLDPSTNQLVITGSGFGTPTGSAAILFDDCNDGNGGTPWVINATDNTIVSWTNTQIIVKVPSRAGTGFFSVKDASGAQTQSSSYLQVLYSVLTATFSGATKQVNNMNTNGSGGYSIYYSTSTAGGGINIDTAIQKETYQRTLATWKEIVGYNGSEAGTTTGQNLANDGENRVMFDNTNSGVTPLASGVLAVTYSWFLASCVPNSVYDFQRMGWDIIIRNQGISVGSTTFTAGPCPPNSSSIDLETVILHEMGHALNHSHINENYEGAVFPKLNPGKLMNYAIRPGVKRSSPDYSAYAGALYTCTPRPNANFGTCANALAPMTQLPTITVPNDECPTVFPTTAVSENTVVNFDLVHATSNKFIDPQYTELTCNGNGTGVTNNAYYPFMTGSSSTMTLGVLNYNTLPVLQAACPNPGVELAIYYATACPGGQNYPSPVACAMFNGNGDLPVISGLLPNTTYLLFVDGIDNTKATFDLVVNKNAMPIKLSSFTGEAMPEFNELRWKIETVLDVNRLVLQRSTNNRDFVAVAQYNERDIRINYSTVYHDAEAVGNNFYRLAVYNKDGSVDYSTVIFLKRTSKMIVSLYPNPVAESINIKFNTANELSNVHLKVYNSVGQLMVNKKLSNIAIGISSEQISASKLAKGFYKVLVTGNENETLYTKNFEKL